MTRPTNPDRRAEILKLIDAIAASGSQLVGERVAILQAEAGDTYSLDGRPTKIAIPDTVKKWNAPKRGTVIAVGSGVPLMEERIDIHPGDEVTYVQPNATTQAIIVDGRAVEHAVIHVLDVYWCWRPTAT